MPFFCASLRCWSIRPGPPPVEFDREPAPELELAVDQVGLPAPDRVELHALAMQPAHRVARAADQPVAQVAVGAVLRDAEHVVVELIGGVGAEVGAVDLVLGQVRHDRLQIVDAVVDAAERAGGEPRVAAHQLLRRALEHEHARAFLARRKRSAKRRIAGADHHHIPGTCHDRNPPRPASRGGRFAARPNRQIALSESRPPGALPGRGSRVRRPGAQPAAAICSTPEIAVSGKASFSRG